MKKLMFSLLLIVISTITVVAQKKKEKSPVENKTYDVTISEVKAGKTGKGVADQISFKSQKIKSKVVEEKIDFAPVKYTITSDSTATESEGDAIRTIGFDAEGTNDKDETLKWTGTITNGAIEGNVVLSKKGKTKKEFTFSGNEKAK